MVISLFQQSGGGGSSGDKIGIAPPTVSSSGLVYDGTAKSPVIGSYNTDAVTVAYTPQTNAGTYNYTLALKDKSKYVWLNTYDSDNQTGTWSIAKANGSSSLSKYAVELEEGESDNVVVTRAGTGAVQAVSSNPSIAAVSVSGTTVTILDGGTEGTATVSISVAADNNYNAVGAKNVTVEVSHGPEIVSWNAGTDEQIVAMVEAADAGKINLSDYWNVGDKRTVSLSAMAATGVGESHRAQNVVLVLVDKNNTNYPYVTATTGRTYCSFVVQQENCLSSTDSGTTSDSERGYMNSTHTNTGSWNGCARRTWCNNVYKNAIPSTLRSIFKQVKVTTAQKYNGSTNQQSDDYFFLPAAAEVFKGDSTYGGGGTAGQQTAYSNLTEFNALTRWKYYETTGNRIKKIGLSGAAYRWWERSPRYADTWAFCLVDNGGNATVDNAGGTYGLAPCGCI